MTNTGHSMNRRQFVRAAATGASLAGLSAGTTLTAAAWKRSFGTNDRIRIGMIGCGDRGRNAHMAGFFRVAK